MVEQKHKFSVHREDPLAIDYKKVGVDIDKGESLVQWLKSQKSSNRAHQDRIVGGIGGFSALFRADFAEMAEPCLVSCTDGVGTKVKLASHFGSYREVAQDLVAMCVNDLLCVGAQPLFFLDYYATSRLDLDAAKDFLSGLQQACDNSELALIGGETAEMPGVYQSNDFDCAGFCVGVVDKEKALGSHRVQAGDHLIALEASGFHSNGFSLIRKIYEKDLDKHKDMLLTPTALYVRAVQTLLKNSLEVRGIANITGGGLDNLLRMMPESCSVNLTPWKIPPQFLEVKNRGEMSWKDLLTTLNCGLGMVMAVSPEDSKKVLSALGEIGQSAFAIGKVVLNKTNTPQWHLDEEELESIQVNGVSL